MLKCCLCSLPVADDSVLYHYEPVHLECRDREDDDKQEHDFLPARDWREDFHSDE